MSETQQPELARLTVELLRAYVSNNIVPSNELADLIETTRAALAGEAQAPNDAAPQHIAAVSVEDSLASPDHIVSLIDGKPYKTLKRHLGNNGLTPEEYKARYKLPADYPLVAPSYSEKRRKVAKNMGLGGRPAAAASTSGRSAPVKASSADEVPVAKTAPAKPAARGTSKASTATQAKTAKPAATRAKKPETPAVTAAAAAPLVTDTPAAGVPAKAAAKPARRMARPKSEAAAAAQAESPATAASAPAKPKARKKLGIRVGTSAKDTASAEPTKPAAKPKTASKAGSGRKGAETKGAPTPVESETSGKA
jgi:predicted transcriptional regulator